MKKPISAIIGLVTFGFWMNIVGDPHVDETVIGLVISSCIAYQVYKLKFWD